MKKLVDVGTVSAVYPERCTARVNFDERDTVTQELFIGVRGSQNTKDYWMPEIGEEVVCIFLPNSTEGFILFSYYGEEDKVPVTNKSKRHIEFKDGTYIEYDSDTHTLDVNTNGEIKITTNSSVTISATSDVHVTGDVFADGISLKNHVHNVSSGGSTSTPIGG